MIKKKFPSLFYYIFFLIIIFSFVVFFIFNANKKAALDFHTIKFNLITSTHTDLPWKFKAVTSILEIEIGKVTNIEYIVENLSNKKTSGIASFAYFPRELEPYIIKIECFCYESKFLEAREKDKYTLTMMIDPEVTKDIKTRSLREAIMQFTFFDSENFKENKSKI